MFNAIPLDQRHHSIVERAKAVILNDGGHSPVLLMELPKRMEVIGLANLDNDSKAQMYRTLGQYLKDQQATGFHLIAEATQYLPPEGISPADVMKMGIEKIREISKQQDILAIVSKEKGGNVISSMYAVIRVNNKVVDLKPGVCVTQDLFGDIVNLI